MRAADVQRELELLKRRLHVAGFVEDRAVVVDDFRDVRMR